MRRIRIEDRKKKVTEPERIEHPKLPLVREILGRRPDLTKSHFSRFYGLPHKTLAGWEKEGLVTFGKAKQSPWSFKAKAK